MSARSDPRSALLKACIFATGLSGIVAEYSMATLASYLLGDAVLHWTLTISWMLFAMGLGSRLSRFVEHHLLDAFVTVELLLSATVALSAPLVYLLAAWVETIGLVIYGVSFAVGLLVGLELPLATRLNERYEELRINVSAVIEKDYYGALLGGVLFAFVALPWLGLTYTPIVLGGINLLVAAALMAAHRARLARRRALTAAAGTVATGLVGLAVLAEPIVLFGEQRRYRDLVVFAEQTRYQRIVLTRFEADHWLYLDGHQQFSSFDEERYHEPLVHPAMTLAAARRRVLVLGGGDGLAVREILKHRGVEAVTVVDRDPRITELARTHPVLTGLNGGALDDPRVRIVHDDAYAFLLGGEGHRDAGHRPSFWDVVVIDLPDPKSPRLARLYSRPFYRLAARRLSPGGSLATQATSPFFTRRAFLSILRSVRAAGFVAVPLHNHIPTMGEWGFVVGLKPGRGGEAVGEAELLESLAALPLGEGDVPTRFLNRGAMLSMLHFGKGFLDDLEDIEVSEESDLAVFSYYRDGDWKLY